ncbi:acyltransferase family protein [Chitinophaga qingshengii]|uniref:Acyltransferase n=1 Tax=Chitinophaga qingshengii TaxID=1569794 RepID=A0ABR7TUB8_9BACT|nr:acyltransferase [Chitinophaga qingshengii]MBC9933207.1 acyltransferase [Chitinophaga qingshengii]
MSTHSRNAVHALLPKIASLDHLRAFAIFFVFYYHYRIFPHPDWLNTPARFGWTGVDLFFVLSGYLISGQLFKGIAITGTVRLKPFYIKRFFRIIPPYLLVLVLYVCLPSFREKEMLPPLWKFLTFTQNFGLDLKTYGTFSHAWSLCVEEQFYILFPCLLSLLLHVKAGHRAFWLIPVLFIGGFVCRWWIYTYQVSPMEESPVYWVVWYKAIYYPVYNRLDGLLAGVAIAALFQFKPLVKEWVNKFANLFFVAGLALLTAAWFVTENSFSQVATVYGFPLVSAGYGLIVAAAVCPRCWLYSINSRITAFIAALSYAIYLSHKGVIHVTQELLGSWGMAKNSGWMMLICSITCILAAWLIRIVVEKPALKIRDRILGKQAVTYDAPQSRQKVA